MEGALTGETDATNWVTPRSPWAHVRRPRVASRVAYPAVLRINRVPDLDSLRRPGSEVGGTGPRVKSDVPHHPPARLLDHRPERPFLVPRLGPQVVETEAREVRFLEPLVGNVAPQQVAGTQAVASER